MTVVKLTPTKHSGRQGGVSGVTQPEMNFPEKAEINITQFGPCPQAHPSLDPSVLCPREREPLLPSPFSSHFCQVGAKCQNPPKIQDQYFLETRTRILVAPTFKEKLPLQASRPFPEGAPRKVSMFKIYLAGRSSDMSVSCPEAFFPYQNGKIQVVDFSGF